MNSTGLVNNSAKHWPIFFVIFGMQHFDETWRKWLYTVPQVTHCPICPVKVSITMKGYWSN